MGIKKNHSSLADALFSSIQQRVYAQLFGQPQRSFYANELIRLVGGGSGAVQRELRRMLGAGLITAKTIGNQKHYQANTNSPVFSELAGIVRKTVGLVEPIREALTPIMSQIQFAFVFGSFAKGSDHADSDIDLFLVSNKLTYGEVFRYLETLSDSLGRQVNPTVYTEKELGKRIKDGRSFVSRVMKQPKLWIFGDPQTLASGESG